MKKFVVLFVAVMLAVPAMSYAGSATSRWDMSIGGQVKLDLVYTDQTDSSVASSSERDGFGGNTNVRTKYGALTWGSGETRLNFLVKGPDTWGAKTSAFVEMQARGVSSNAIASNVRSGTEEYGNFAMQHAFMKFDWPSFSLVMGRTFTVPGSLPCFCVFNPSDLGAFNRGGIKEQIYGVWQATKQFSVTLGIMNGASTTGWPGGTPTNGLALDQTLTTSLVPLGFAEFLYKTDACGKIGPWMLQFGVGGVIGQMKASEPSFFGVAGEINSATSANTVSSTTINGVQTFNPNGYDDNKVKIWLATFKTFIPIIPEKAPGKLANALSLAVSLFTAQNYRFLAGPTPNVTADYEYNRVGNTFAAGQNAATVVGGQPAGLQNSSQARNPNANFTAPVVTGGWGQLAYHITDTVWVGFYYGQERTMLSQPRKNSISPGALEKNEEYVVNLVYDPNPAIRLGLQWNQWTSHWARSLHNQKLADGVTPSGLTSSNTQNAVRFAAQYFF